jgi:exodeoxyribonuclease I
MTDINLSITHPGLDAPSSWREHGLPVNLASLASHFEQLFSDGSDQPNGYVFWDCETTGLSPQHDQILQLAAIRTDSKFNIVDDVEDVLNIRCDLAPGIVPSPTALLTTRVWPEQLSGTGMKLPAMIDRVAEVFDRWRLPRLGGVIETKRVDSEHNAIGMGPTVFLGWNSLRFDEEFLRHALFKNLHAPYLTQSSGALRADVMTMAQAAHLLHPGSIEVPEIVDTKTGKTKLSFRLGNLARANGITFDETTAHDALSDVYATIAVCKLIFERAPEAFDLMIRNSLKPNVNATITANWAGVAGLDPHSSPRITSTTASHIGASKHIMQPYAVCCIHSGKASARAVMPIGSLPNGGPLAALDLSIDPASYLSLSDDDLRLLAKDKTRWPVVSIRANRQPILLPLELRQDNLPPVFQALVERIAVDGGDTSAAQAILVNRLERIRKAELLEPGRVARLIMIAQELMPEYPISELIEEQLYSGGFPPRADEGLRERMRVMPPQEFIRHMLTLRDPRLREFAARRAYATFPELLPEDERNRLKMLFGSRVSDPAGQPWRTSTDAYHEIEKLRAQLANEPEQLLPHLDAIEVFIDQLFSSAVIDAVGGPDPDDLNGLG